MPTEEPLGVVTTMVVAPEEIPAGVTIVTEVDEFTTKLAARPPTVTPVVLPNSAPVMVTEVPPSTIPEVGLTLDMVGSALET